MLLFYTTPHLWKTLLKLNNILGLQETNKGTARKFIPTALKLEFIVLENVEKKYI